MGKDHWDAILTSTPLNATAGAVTSKGYEYEPAVTLTEMSWDGPPAITKPNGIHLRNPSFTDFTGKAFGRLTVLGMLADNPQVANDHGAVWVCRCSCGRYVGRRAKAIRKGSEEARCGACMHTAYLARSASGNIARLRAESSKAKKW